MGKDEPWSITAVYAQPEDNILNNLWLELEELAGFIMNAWMLAGNFNSIKFPEETTSASRYTMTGTLN